MNLDNVNVGQWIGRLGSRSHRVARVPHSLTLFWCALTTCGRILDAEHAYSEEGGLGYFASGRCQKCLRPRSEASK